MLSALPPRAGDSPGRRPPGAAGVSRLAVMQARFQAKQLEEKEEKLIHMLEEKQGAPQEETIQRVNYGRDSANSVNSLSSSASSNSLSGSAGQRPAMYAAGGGRVRQMFEQRRHAPGLDRGRVSPVGWDKSHPLDPVEAVNPEMSRSGTGLYKQNVARNNSYNKYSGNYGPRAGAPSGAQARRGLSLDRSRARQQAGYGQSPGLVRAQSQANMQGYGGRARQASGGSLAGPRYEPRGYEVSPEDSPPLARRAAAGYGATERDYTRPLPPTYRRERAGDPSPSRHSYHDSAYSSHSSHSSDNPAFSVLPAERRAPASNQSSPAKSYSRQNSFSYDANPRINSRTFRKQKSPQRNRSPSLSPSRSGENSDETDLSHGPPAEEFAARQATRTAEREREEERRRMQVEMRKREQELLARIKEQQRELDAVKAEKSKVEKQLTRQEREREEERRRAAERERRAEEELHLREAEERRQGEEAARRSQHAAAARPHERVLARDKASPAHLRGRRPPSLVSSDTEPDPVTAPCTTPPPTHVAFSVDLADISDMEGPESPEEPAPPRSLLEEAEAVVALLRPPPASRPQAQAVAAGLARRPSLRRREEEQEVAGPLARRPSLRRRAEEAEPAPALVRRPSLRRSKEEAERIRGIQASPSTRRKEFGLPEEGRRAARREVPSPSATPTLRRKGSIRHTLESLRAGASETDEPKEPKEAKEAKRPVSRSGSQRQEEPTAQGPAGRSRLRGRLSREPSFDATYAEEAREPPAPSRPVRNKTITINPNNSVNIEIKSQAKKPAVPPSPAASKKTPGAARRSVFAPKPRDDLTACRHCQRNFAEDRVEKHEEICLKTGQKKRKVFDMTKTRVKGTDAAKFVKSGAQLKAMEAKGGADQKKANWRKKREEFINTLRAAKEAQRHVAAGGSLKDLPPPPPMDTSDYIQCPHCQRRFAEAAADRHIPKCKDIKSNKKR